MLTRWFVAFWLTQAIEAPIYTRALGDGPLRRRVAIAFMASVLTHPLVWIGMLYVLPGSYAVRLAITEIFAWWVEAWWLARFGVRGALWWSLFANATSAGIGSLTQALFDWP